MSAEVVSLHYQEYGQGEALIILHGFLGSSGNWHSLSKNQFGASYRVFTVDLRNHGRSPHTPVFDYPSMAADVLALMDALGLSQAHILGHSMGGKVAMYLALHHADRVESVIVADMAPRAYPPGHLSILRALQGLNLAAYTSRSEIDEALSASISEWGIRQFLLKNLESDGKGTYTWKNNLDGLAQYYDNILVAISHSGTPFLKPALFIRGEASNYVTEEDLVDIAMFFPAYSLMDLQGAGHWVHAEKPGPFAEAVLHFLNA